MWVLAQMVTYVHMLAMLIKVATYYNLLTALFHFDNFYFPVHVVLLYFHISVYTHPLHV